MNTPHWQNEHVTLHHGDCIGVMRELADESVDAVCTDPPYALEFMGKGWDKFTPLEFELWCAEWAAECLRVLKPGGHMLASLDLMRWLVRLVTPPGGVVLEPLAGSGTTVEAAVLEGFQCIAIEREADYLPLIEQRLSKPMQQSLFDDLLGGVA